ncbi:MFS transporter [Undibacterium sp. RTI2.1]|uniref:MFS transporter n=1 Tax=unclassified Undibacterium TaxID=2630295 RepID=UPI002B230C73|nr:MULTISPECIES: MFS transporter [unclassified Undibacterium]MEB0032204.1 MFS transporter [Undibacterium sp. RTI2.1]MEB0118278.1 MFS transporter [Undibacterium sp. RTI2.2]
MNQVATLDVRQFINQRTMSSFQWLLVGLCFLIVAVDGMDVAIMGFAAPSILADWHISRSAFGLVMGAAPVGLALGALIAGSSSDWLGRRKVLIGSVFGFGVFTVFAAFSNNPTEMAVLRFLTGFGLGAAMPNASTLMSEYVPERSRGVLLTTMFTGFNLGSASIGFVAAYMLPVFGWKTLLLFGGCVPLALVPVLYLYLPESARFMVVRGFPVKQIRSNLSRVCRINLDTVTSFVSPEATAAVKQPISVLFSGSYTLRTITLWITYFMGLMVIYLATSWMPTMMNDAGMSLAHAANLTAMFQLGGTIGAILIGMLMDRYNPNRIIALSYVVGSVLLILLGLSGLQSGLVVILVAAVGFFLSGAQTGLNAFAPGCYPTVARATGVSWMLGIGRMGSILGSSIGGYLLGMGWGFETIISILAIPALIAALAIFINRISFTQTQTD